MPVRSRILSIELLALLVRSDDEDGIAGCVVSNGSNNSKVLVVCTLVEVGDGVGDGRNGCTVDGSAEAQGAGEADQAEEVSQADNDVRNAEVLCTSPSEVETHQEEEVREVSQGTVGVIDEDEEDSNDEVKEASEVEGPATELGADADEASELDLNAGIMGSVLRVGVVISSISR